MRANRTLAKSVAVRVGNLRSLNQWQDDTVRLVGLKLLIELLIKQFLEYSTSSSIIIRHKQSWGIGLVTLHHSLDPRVINGHMKVTDLVQILRIPRPYEPHSNR